MAHVSYKIGVLLVMCAGLCWSGMGTSIRFVDNATTWQILFYRSLGMIFILLIYVFWHLNYRIVPPGVWVPSHNNFILIRLNRVLPQIELFTKLVSI